MGEGEPRLVPVRAFYAGHMTERTESERTGRPVRCQHLFRLPGARAFLLAAVREGDRVSIVATKPNASVAPVLDCIPLVLEPRESSAWLGPEFAQLVDRLSATLISTLEQGNEGDKLSQYNERPKECSQGILSTMVVECHKQVFA